MRHYPTDSPQAAARIIALTVVADGEIDQTELDLLDLLGVDTQLGLGRGELQIVLDTFCEDLLSSHQLQLSDACPVDDATLMQLMGDIQSPALRKQLLRLCIDIAESDSYVAQGEAIVLNAAVEHWGLQRFMLEQPHVQAKPPERACAGPAGSQA